MGGLKKGYKRVENTDNINLLSNDQEETLYYLTQEYLTPKQIANKRKSSVQAVYKIIRKLKSKGFIKVVSNGCISGGYYSVPTNTKTYRLHAQSFTIDILEGGEYYEKILNKITQDELDNNTIMLYNNQLVVYANKDFWGDTVNESVKLSLDYWSRFIVMLENNYKIILKKYKICKIKQFRGEIAKIGDPVAREINLSDNKLKVYDGEGTLRLIVDKSFKFDELEAVSREHHIKDMGKIEEKWLDLLENESYKLSEASKLLMALEKRDNTNTQRIDKVEAMLQQILEIQNTNAVMMMTLTKTIERLGK